MNRPGRYVSCLSGRLVFLPRLSDSELRKRHPVIPTAILANTLQDKVHVSSGIARTCKAARLKK